VYLAQGEVYWKQFLDLVKKENLQLYLDQFLEFIKIDNLKAQWNKFLTHCTAENLNLQKEKFVKFIEVENLKSLLSNLPAKTLVSCGLLFRDALEELFVQGFSNYRQVYASLSKSCLLVLQKQTNEERNFAVAAMVSFFVIWAFLWKSVCCGKAKRNVRSEVNQRYEATTSKTRDSGATEDEASKTRKPKNKKKPNKA